MSAKYDAILTATSNLIYEQGLQSVSMSQIAKAAGVGIGTIYNYFPTKEDLVNILFGHLAKSLSDQTLDRYDVSQSYSKRAQALCHNLLVYGLNHPRDMLLFEQLNHSPYIRPEVQEHDYGVKEAFFTLIQAAQAEGMVKPISPIMLGNIQISYVAAIVRSNTLNQITVDEPLIAELTQAWLDLIQQ